MNLKSGKYYWFRSKRAGDPWRISYVGNDCDDNQHLHLLGVDDAWSVSKMKLEMFDFIEIPQPDQPAELTLTLDGAVYRPSIDGRVVENMEELQILPSPYDYEKRYASFLLDRKFIKE